MASDDAPTVRVEVGVERNSREVRRIEGCRRGTIDGNLCIAIAKEGIARLKHMFRTVARIDELGESRAQVVAIEVAILKQLGGLYPYHGTCRPLSLQAEGTRDVLPKIEHALTRWGTDDFGNEGLMSNHGQRQTRAQLCRNSLRLVSGQQLGSHGCNRRQRVVEVLAVVDVRKRHVVARDLPAVVRADNLFGSVCKTHA